MQVNVTADWVRVWGLATVTVAALAGFATEILHLSQAGF
jgi:hypothetical protein